MKTRAAVLHSFNQDLVVEEIDIDTPLAHEVLIRVKASGVCHTDRTMQLGANALPLPLVLGHEVSGVVEQVGSSVTYVQPGDHVSTCASAFCGYCRWCQVGQLQHCMNKNRSRAAGESPRLSQNLVSVEPFVGLGGFADHVLVHESAVVKLPQDLPMNVASLLGCAVATGIGAVTNTAKVQFGDTVAVIGCGGVGLNVIQGARLAGARRIIAIDLLDEKLMLAREFGATDTVNSAQDDPIDAVRSLISSGVTHGFDVVGRPETMQQGFAMLEERGTLTMVGVPRPEVTASLPLVDFLLEKRVQGTKMGSTRFRQDIPIYAELYLQGRLKLTELVSRHVPLTGVNEALADLDLARAARTVITFDD